MHYARILRYGGPGPIEMVGKWASLEQRYWDRVQAAGPLLISELGNCHLWTGAVHASGFGVIGYKGRKLYAHRVAWQFAYGNVPLGNIQHLCDNRLCVRADHLSAGAE